MNTTASVNKKWGNNRSGRLKALGGFCNNGYWHKVKTHYGRGSRTVMGYSEFGMNLRHINLLGEMASN
jgi:hypothetical protein